MTGVGREAGPPATGQASRARTSSVSFDAIAAGYDQAMTRVSAPFVSDLLAACALAPGQWLLDVGTGTGLVAAAAGTSGGTGVVGLDVSATMLARARHRTADLGVHLVAGDAVALPFRERSFDAAAGHFVLVFLDRPEAALAEIHRALRPGGCVALTVLARPEATAYGPVLEALGRRVAPPRDLLERLCSLGRSDRLAGLLVAGGFREVRVERVRHEVRWRSVSDYWSVIEAGSGLAGHAYRSLPEAIRGGVQEEVEQAVAAHLDAAGLAWEVEALLGAARR